MRLTKLLLGLVLFALTPPSPLRAADLSQIVADAAKWESGQSLEPLRQVEQLVRDSAGKPAQRAELEAALVKLLTPSSTFEAKRFACQQLALVGTDASTSAIAELLKENTTIGIACLAFSHRPSAQADTALRAALTTARNQGRLQIISTLGSRRDVKAVKPLAALTHDADVVVVEAAVRALGMIADEPASQVLARLRTEVRPPYNQTLADASLRCAEALAQAGNRKAAAAIYEEFVLPPQFPHIRRGAFNALLPLDTDAGEQRILNTLHGSDRTLKPDAIAAVRALPSAKASETFARELPSLSSQEQVWLIDSLAVRADVPARAAVMVSLESADADVRRAAATALGRIGGATAVPPLAKAIAAAKDVEEVRLLVSALGSLPSDRDTDKAIITEIKDAQGETRARLMSVLATRPGPQVTAVLLEEADHPDPAVAKAAYRILARAGADKALPALVAKFAALRNAALRAEVEGFVEQAISATEDSARRSTVVRDELGRANEVETRCALLRLLPACGDAAALAALNSALMDPDARVQAAAVRALAEWPNLAAWDRLSAIWAKPGSDAQRALALRGLVRLADEANAAPDEKLIARYRELVEGARDDDELKQVLSALGGAAHPEALKLALPLLERPGIRPEAEAAVKRIAGVIKAKYPEAAKAALDRAARKN